MLHDVSFSSSPSFIIIIIVPHRYHCIVQRIWPMFQQYIQSVGIIYHVYLATDKHDGRSERFEPGVILFHDLLLRSYLYHCV